jgi:hypothetical protein
MNNALLVYLQRTTTSKPAEREDGSEYCQLFVTARGLDHNCTRISFIADVDKVEDMLDDMKAIGKRKLSVELSVEYKEETYEGRTVWLANGHLNELGMAIDDALDALDG